jgi:hypothetical protein
VRSDEAVAATEGFFSKGPIQGFFNIG